MDTGASLTVKNIGKPCTGKPYARFDEGALMKVWSLEHVVAACGKASVKDPKGGPIQCSSLPRLHAEENSTYLIKGEPYASFPSGPFTRRPDIFSYCC